MTPACVIVMPINCLLQIQVYSSEDYKLLKKIVYTYLCAGNTNAKH